MTPLDSDPPEDQFTVSALESGNRLDSVLAQHYPDLHSRTYFAGLIETGNVFLNGKQVKKRTLVREDEQVKVIFRLRPELSLGPEKMDFDILYEDPFLLAINKPAGLVVHPAPGNWSGTFVHGLLYHCQTLSLSQDHLRPGIVHRLDKDTTGVLLAAKQPLAHERLINAFAKRQVHKKYLAICVNSPGSGELTTQIDRDPKTRLRMAVVQEGGRIAITQYRTLITNEGLALVEIKLLTGRTHQARVHMKHCGAPVLGDALYGSPIINARYDARRQMLHAYELSLQHPITGEPLHLQAKIPEDMQLLLEKYFPGYSEILQNLAKD